MKLELIAELRLRMIAVLFLVIVFLGANWLADLGENCVRMDCYLTNGFWDADAMRVYHGAWYIWIFAFIAMSLLALTPIKVRAD